MAQDMFTIGDKVEIAESSAVHNGIVDDNNDPVLVSQIYDIIDSDHLQLEMPFRGTQIVLLNTRVRYQICIYTSHGLFKTTVQVTDRFKQENHYIAAVEVKSAFKRVQRREYFRLEKLLEIKYRYLTEEETQKMTTQEIIDNEDPLVEYKAAIAVDLSGGGARLVMNQKCKKDDMIMVKFAIAGEGEEINFVARVITSTQMKMDTSQYENRVKFIKVKENQREKIIRYIFEEERKMRFKEKS